MSAAEALLPVSAEPIGIRLRRVDIHWKIVAQLALCTAPAAALFALGSMTQGSQIFVALLSALLSYYVVSRCKYEFLAVAIGSLPMLSFTRGFFVFYSIFFFLALGLLLWGALEPSAVVRLWKDPIWKLLALLACIFWWISAALNMDYTSNMRVLELVFSTGCTVLLASRRSYLATAMIGFAVSHTALALGVMSHSGGRLGMIEMNDVLLGNPIYVGLPGAVILLMVLADEGRWMLLEGRIFLRSVICITAAVWLLLSGSRGSWIATLAAFFTILFWGGKARKSVIASILLVALATTVLLSTKAGENVTKQVEKLADNDRTIANRTSGRSIQWSVIPTVFLESPVWGWGPGSGREVAYLYTGRHLGWHALYLQVIGETGIIGVIALLSVLIPLVARCNAYRRQFGEITPLAAIMTYIAIGISVSAMDSVSGICLGLAFAARNGIPQLMIREGLISDVQMKRVSS